MKFVGQKISINKFSHCTIAMELHCCLLEWKGKSVVDSVVLVLCFYKVLVLCFYKGVSYQWHEGKGLKWSHKNLKEKWTDTDVWAANLIWVKVSKQGLPEQLQISLVMQLVHLHHSSKCLASFWKFIHCTLNKALATEIALVRVPWMYMLWAMKLFECIWYGNALPVDWKALKF